MYQTALPEDEAIGRKEQYFLKPGAFLLSEVVSAKRSVSHGFG